jgi:hypothetical protein
MSGSSQAPLPASTVREALSWLENAGNEEVELALPLDVGRARRNSVVSGAEEFVSAYPRVSFALTERPLTDELLRIRLQFAGPARDLSVLVGSFGQLMRQLAPDADVAAAGIGITARRLGGGSG